jgi:transposase
MVSTILQGDFRMVYVVKQKTKTGRVNIYLAESQRVSGKQIRQIRKYLGVLSQSNSELLLSSTASQLISNDIISMLLEKGITYNGNRADRPGRKCTSGQEVNDKGRISIKSLESSSTFEHGRVDALRYLAEKSGLSSCLTSVFEKDLADKILGLAMFQVCESSSLYLTSEWCAETNLELELSSASVSRALYAIGHHDSAIQAFFAKWIDVNGKPTSLIHDTTSISSYSNAIDEVEWGYNRDEENLPQINLAMVVERTARVPLWYRIIPGSIPDVSSLKKTCEIVRELGIEKFSFSLDRGFFSASNINTMISEKLGFIIGVPCHHSQPSELICANYERLMSIDNITIINGHRVRYANCIYRLAITDSEFTDICGHIFVDLERREYFLKKIETGVAEIKAKSRAVEFSTEIQAKAWIKDVSGPLNKYFTVSEIDNRYTVALNKEKYGCDYKKFGVMMVLTSETNSNHEQVLSDYRCRDIVEKVFDKLKNGIGFNRIRCSSNDNAEGRVFVAFIATILRISFENRLKKHVLLKKYSIDEALAILKKVKSIVLPNGKIVKREIPAKCREILDACYEKGDSVLTTLKGK